MDERYLKLIELWCKYWNERNPEELVKIFTPEFIYDDVSSGTVNHNLEEQKKFMNKTFAMSPDIKWTIENSFVKDNKGCVEWIMTGTQTGAFEKGIPATNKKFEIKGSSVFLFEGDKIKKCADYCDLLTLMKQIGIMK